MTLLFILHTCVAAARTVECAVVDLCAVLLIKHLRTMCDVWKLALAVPVEAVGGRLASGQERALL